MINGLIFFANIVWTYQSVLFPDQIPSELIFLKIFIAWLNLDFEIEMCFINNLNAFGSLGYNLSFLLSLVHCWTDGYACSIFNSTDYPL